MTTEARKVVGAVTGVRAHLAKRLGLMVGLWLAVGVLAVLTLAPWLAGSAGWNPGSPVPLVLVAVIVLAVGGGALAWRTLRSSWAGEGLVARSMEDATRLREGSVMGSLELARHLPPGTSDPLRLEALRRVGERLVGPPGELAGGVGARIQGLVRRGATSLFAVVPLLALTVLFAPGRTMGAWRGLLHPVAVISEPRLPPVTVTPGTMEVSRGEEVIVSVEAPLRESVSLHWEMTGQVVQSRTLSLEEGRGTGTLPPVTAEIRYWVQAPDGGRSGVHTLTPVDPLFVSTYSVEVTYPPYTGLGAEEYRNEVPELLLPVGTHLRIQGQGSRGIGLGELRDASGEAVAALGVTDARFVGSWTPRRSGTYAWSFTDLAGAEAAVIPEPLRIQLIPDSVPGIAIAAPGPDTVLPVDLRQPLVLRTWDDYGLDRVELVARRVSAFGESSEPVTLRIELGGTQAAVARPILDVSQWGVTPGDTIRYLARAIDNHPSGQVSETAEYVLRVPQTNELERAAQEELDRAADRVEALAEEAARAEQEARDLQRQGEQARERNQSGDPGSNAEFEEREEISQALERQNEMLQAVDSLQQELAELREALADAGLADPELRNRLRELESVLDDMEPTEGSQEVEEAQERLSEMDPAELEELLEQMAADQEQLRQRLEDSLDQFRQAAIEQDFRATGQEAQDLAEEQELLAEALQEAGDPSLRAEQQSELEARAEDLQEQLETLQQRLDEAGEQNAGAGVQEARHQLSQARQQMQQAAQQAQQGNQQSAGSQAQEAAQDLSEVSQELSQAQQQMQQQMAEALQRALGQTATDALALARRQSELRDEMQGRSQGDLVELRGDEAALAQGIRNLAENYAEGTQMAAPGSRDLMEAVGKAMESLDGTIEAMEGRRGRNPSPMSAAEAVVEALNEVAMLAMTAGEQGQGQGSASASQQMMQQLQQLAQQQGELMNDAASLQPMQLGQETMSQQMEEMAGEQEQIAEDLGEMSGEEAGQEGEPMGDLDGLAQEALELAQALAQGRLDPEVLRRQERLFHRLLDAGRSLERDEDSEERESEAPGSFSRDEVAELSAGELDALRFRLPGARALRALSPAQRALVLEYFERLNRTGDPPPPGNRDR